MPSTSRALAALLLVAAAASCSDSTGPKRGTSGNAHAGAIAVNPVFSKSAKDIAPGLGSFGLTYDHVHVQVRQLADTAQVVADTSAAFTPETETLSLDLTVPVTENHQAFNALVEYISSSGVVIFRGSQTVVSYNEGEQPPEQGTITLQFVGPGAKLKTLTLAPSPLNVTGAVTAMLTVTATDSSGAPMAVPPLVLSSSDENIATVALNDAGVPLVTTTGERGSAIITATTPNGVTGSTTVSVTLPPAFIGTVAGNEQTGVVGHALKDPVTIVVTDRGEVPLAGVSVLFAAPQGGSVGTATAVTDSTGHASTTLTLGTTAGPQQFVATVQGSELTATISATATPDVANGDKSTLTTSRTTLTTDDTSRATISVKARDQYDNPITGATIALATNLGTFPGGQAVDPDSDGTYVAQFASTTPGTATITAKVNDVAVTNSLTITVNAGAVDHFTVTAVDGSGIGTQVAGDTVAVRIAALDAGGHLASSFVGSPTLTVANSAFFVNGSRVASITAPQAVGGITTANVVFAQSGGNVVLTAGYEASGVTATGQSVQFAVAPGAPDAAHTTLTSDVTAVTTDTSSHATITAKAFDRFGNALSMGGAHVSVTTTLGRFALLSPPDLVEDENNGSYMALFSSTEPGTATITAAINGTPIPAVVHIDVGAGAVNHFDITVPAGVQVGVPATVQITARDAAGNTVASYVGEPTLQVTNSAFRNGATATTLVAPAAVAGVSTVSVVFGTAATNAVLTASSGAISGTTAAFAVTASVQGIQLVSGSGQSGVVGTQLPQPIVVKVTGPNDVPLSGVTVTFAAPTGGGVGTTSATTGSDGQASTTATLPTTVGAFSYTATASIDGGTPQSLSVSATATPGPVNAGHTTITSSPTTVVAEDSVPTTITVKAFDQYGNPLTTGGSTVRLTTTLGMFGIDGPQTITATDLGNGSYTASFYALDPGTAHITGTVNGTAIASLDLTVNPAPVNRFDVVDDATGEPIGNQVAGSTITVRVTARTAHGLVATNYTGQPGLTVTNATFLNGGTVTNSFALPVMVAGVTTSPVTFASGGTGVFLEAAAVVDGRNVSGRSATFAVNTSVTGIEIISGNTQTGVAGSVLAQPAVVRVLGPNSLPLPNVTVTFTPPDGGSVGSPTTVTNSQGQAQSTLTAPRGVGQFTYLASAIGTAGESHNISFTVTTTPDKASGARTTLSSNADSLAMGERAILTVRAFDQFGNARPAGDTVRLRTNLGGFASGSGQDTTLFTNGDGAAVIQFSSANAGAAVISGTIDGAAIADTARITISLPDVNGMSAGSLQDIAYTAGQSIQEYPSVHAVNASGGSVANVKVAFAVTAGACRMLSTTPVLTNADGNASLNSDILAGTGSTAPSSCAITATAPDYPALAPVLFHVIGRPDNAEVWLGTASTDWANEANWLNGSVPNADGPTGPIFIPTNVLRQPLLGADQNGSHGLVMESGATFGLGGHNFTLSAPAILSTVDSGAISNGTLLVQQASGGTIRGLGYPSVTCQGGSVNQDGAVQVSGTLLTTDCVWNLNGSALTVGGSLSMNGSGSGATTGLRMGTGTVATVRGDVTVTGPTSANYLVGGDLLIRGNFAVGAGGNFSSGSTTVHIAGTVAQRVNMGANGGQFSILAIDNTSAVVTIGSAQTVNFAAAAGTRVQVDTSLTIGQAANLESGASVTIAAGGTIRIDQPFTLNSNVHLTFAGAGSLNLPTSQSGPVLTLKAGSHLTINGTSDTDFLINGLSIRDLGQLGAGLCTGEDGAVIDGTNTAVVTALSSYCGLLGAFAGFQAVGDASITFPLNSIPSKYPVLMSIDSAGRAYPGESLNLSASSPCTLLSTSARTDGSGLLTIDQSLLTVPASSTPYACTLTASAIGRGYSPLTFQLISMPDGGSMWLGVANTDWANDKNWFKGAVPTTATTLSFIPDGLTNLPVLTGDASGGQGLYVTKGTAVDLGGHTLTVSGSGGVTVGSLTANDGGGIGNGIVALSSASGGIQGILPAVDCNTGTMSQTANVTLASSLNLNRCTWAMNGRTLAIAGNLVLAAGEQGLQFTTDKDVVRVAGNTTFGSTQKDGDYATGSLQVLGNFTINGGGVFLSTGTEVEVMGTAAQQFSLTSGSAFSKLSIENTTDTVTFTAPLVVNGQLVLANGAKLNVASGQLSASASTLDIGFATDLPTVVELTGAPTLSLGQDANAQMLIVRDGGRLVLNGDGAFTINGVDPATLTAKNGNWCILAPKAILTGTNSKAIADLRAACKSEQPK